MTFPDQTRLESLRALLDAPPTPPSWWVRLGRAVVPMLMASACAPSPTAPSVVAAAPAPYAISYDINVPRDAQALNAQYPNGVTLSPVEAQLRWDYTAYYGGSNVYYGVASPPPQTTVGLVVAPPRAAQLEKFTHDDWDMCPVTCTWIGHFANAVPLK